MHSITQINNYILFDTKKVVESVEDHHTTKMLHKNVKKRTHHSCPSGLPASSPHSLMHMQLVYPIKSCQLSSQHTKFNGSECKNIMSIPSLSRLFRV
jgi:hypothetical protein